MGVCVVCWFCGLLFFVVCCWCFVGVVWCFVFVVQWGWVDVCVSLGLLVCVCFGWSVCV